MALYLAVLQKGAKFGVSGIFDESTVNLGKRNKQSLGMRFIFLCFSEIIFLNEKGTSLEGKFCMWVLIPPTKNIWHWLPRVSRQGTR